MGAILVIRESPVRSFSIVLGLVLLLSCHGDRPPEVADWPMSHHDPRRSGYQPQGSAPGSSLEFQELLHVPGRGLQTLIGHVRGGSWLEIVRATGETGGVQVIDLEDRTIRWILGSRLDTVGLLIDIDGDGKKEIVASRVSHLADPRLMAVTGDGEILFDETLSCPGCSGLQIQASDATGLLYGVVNSAEGPALRRILAFDPGKLAVVWEYTIGSDLCGVSVRPGPSGNVRITADLISPGNGRYGHGVVPGRDRYTRDSALYFPVLGRGGREIAMRPYAARGRVVHQFWESDVLSALIATRGPEQTITALELHALDGRSLGPAARPAAPWTSPKAPTFLVADLDRDDTDELVVSHPAAHEITVYGYPDLKILGRARANAVTHISAADLNGDGLPEILATAETGVRILDGDLGEKAEIRVAGSLRALPVDLDGDGHLEIVVDCLDGTRLFATATSGFENIVLRAAGAAPAPSSRQPVAGGDLGVAAGPWQFRYRLEELFPPSVVERMSRGDTGPERAQVLRRWLTANRPLIMRTLFVLAWNLPLAPQDEENQRTRTWHGGVARLAALAARDLWQDAEPLRLVDFYSNLSTQESAVFKSARGAWDDHRGLKNEEKWDEARRSLQAAVSGFRRLGEPFGEATFLIQLAEIQRVTGRFDDAVAAADRAIEANAGWFDPLQLASALRVRGDALLLKGEYEEGLATYREARSAAEIADSELALAKAEERLGSLYLGVGNLKEAEAHLRPTLERYREIHLYEDVARVCRKLAQIHIVRGEVGRTAELLAEAEKIARDLDLPSLLADVLLTRAAAGGTTRPGTRTRTLAEALRIGMDNRFPTVRARALAGIAARELDNGAFELAETHAKEAGQLARDLGIRDLGWRCLAIAARARERTGDSDAALSFYVSAIDQISAFRADLATERLRYGFLGARIEPFEGALRTIVALNRERPGRWPAGSALEVLERCRARALADEIASASRKAPVEAEGQTILNTISVLQETLWRGDLEEDARAEIQRSLDRSRCRFDGMCRRQEVARARGLLRYATPRATAAIQDHLAATHTALLAYHLSDDVSYGIYADREAVRLAELPPRDEVENAARRFREMVRGAPTWRGTVDSGTALAEMLLEPFAEELREDGLALAVMADGSLHDIPFGAMPDPDTGEPLSLEHPVFFTPSGSVLVALSERLRTLRARPWPLEFAGFAVGRWATSSDGFSELPGVADEVRSAARQFEVERSRVYTEASASEAAFKGLSPGGARVVHLASHAGLPRGAGRPSVRFAQGIGDATLTVEEVEQLWIPCELFYLSACRTATGESIPGEGMLGLTRALLGSGASSVVATLWNVEDKPSAVAARRFYEHWLAGRTKAQALAAAQAERYRKGAKPDSWAGFIIVGDAMGG